MKIDEFYQKRLLRQFQQLYPEPDYSGGTLSKILCFFLGHKKTKCPEEIKAHIWSRYKCCETYCARCGVPLERDETTIREGKTLKWRRYSSI